MASQRFNAQRLLKKHFSGHSPMQVKMDPQETITQSLQQELEGMRYVSVRKRSRYHHTAEDDNYVCSLFVQFPNGYSPNSFILELNEQGELKIVYEDNEKLISALDEVIALANDCQEIAEHRHTAVHKRKKILELKDKTILARVKKLAKEERFTFCVITNTRKVKVYIKLDDIENFMVSIPYNQFQEAVPRIRTAILTLRDLHQQGIRFRLSQTSPIDRYNRAQWITPESLDQEDTKSNQ